MEVQATTPRLKKNRDYSAQVEHKNVNLSSSLTLLLFVCLVSFCLLAIETGSHIAKTSLELLILLSSLSKCRSQAFYTVPRSTVCSPEGCQEARGQSVLQLLGIFMEDLCPLVRPDSGNSIPPSSLQAAQTGSRKTQGLSGFLGYIVHP